MYTVIAVDTIPVLKIIPFLNIWHTCNAELAVVDAFDLKWPFLKSCDFQACDDGNVLYIVFTQPFLLLEY